MDVLLSLPGWVWFVVGYMLVGMAYAEWSCRQQRQVIENPQSEEDFEDQKEYYETRTELIELIGERGWAVADGIISFLAYVATVLIWPVSVVMWVYYLIRG